MIKWKEVPQPLIIGYFSDKGGFYIQDGQTYTCKEPFKVPKEAKNKKVIKPQNAKTKKELRALSKDPEIVAIWNSLTDKEKDDMIKFAEQTLIEEIKKEQEGENTRECQNQKTISTTKT